MSVMKDYIAVSIISLYFLRAEDCSDKQQVPTEPEVVVVPTCLMQVDGVTMCYYTPAVNQATNR